MDQGLADWEDEMEGDIADGAGLPALDWDQMSAGPTLPGLEETSLYEDSPVPDDLRVTEYGASPWSPGGGTGYQPWAQAQTDSPPMGDLDEPVPALNAHPGVDPETIYDRDSYEEPIEDRQTYGAGIFDLPDQGAVFNRDDGIFANDYALPAYMAREPQTDVFESEALDVNTGLPRVVQGNASGVQLMREEPDRAWSPFAQPYATSSPQNRQPYTQQTLHNFGSDIEKFGSQGAKAILNTASVRAADQGSRGQFICNMIDSMVPNLSPRALAAVAQLKQANYPGNAVELVVAHCLMFAAENDLMDSARSASGGGRLRRLDQLCKGCGSPELSRAAVQHLGPAAGEPARAAHTVQAFRNSKAGATTRSMLGDADAQAPRADAPSSGGQVLKYGALGAVALTAGYFGWQWWKKQKK